MGNSFSGNTQTGQTIIESQGTSKCVENQEINPSIDSENEDISGECKLVSNNLQKDAVKKDLESEIYNEKTLSININTDKGKEDDLNANDSEEEDFEIVESIMKEGVLVVKTEDHMDANILNEANVVDPDKSAKVEIAFDTVVGKCEEKADENVSRNIQSEDINKENQDKAKCKTISDDVSTNEQEEQVAKTEHPDKKRRRRRRPKKQILISDNPGAARYGNFINYYEFNPALRRVDVIPKDVWLPFTESEDVTTDPYFILDVGCNSGELTYLLWEHVKTNTNRRVFILGVEKDKQLVNRAEHFHSDGLHVIYYNLDIMDGSGLDKIKLYLTIFRRKKFDAVCLFSVTMWIHLHHNDVGLQTFLKNMSDIAELLVVEPQGWKSYQSALKRIRKSGEDLPLYKELEWRNKVAHEIDCYLKHNIGRKEIAESIPTHWKRQIKFYR